VTYHCAYIYDNVYFSHIEKAVFSDILVIHIVMLQGFLRVHAMAPAPSPVSSLMEVPSSPYHTPLLLSNTAGTSGYANFY
jgi:hypothetical protein